jgi:zinc protease
MRNKRRYLLSLALCLLSGLALAAPKIQSWTTSKGARVLFVQANALPMLDIRVVFDAGGARDGGHPGLAAFTNGVLTEGAGEWDADALSRRLEDRGIELGSGSLRDMAWVSVRTLSDPATRDVALDSVAAILAHPRFDDAAIARVRQQMLVARRQLLQSPGGVASERFYHTLYGDHPYGAPPGGTAASIKAIDKAMLERFHQRYYVAANAVIAMVGKASRAEAERIAERITAGLPRGQHAPPLPRPKPVKGGELRLNFPSHQTHVLIGQLGVTRADPDYFALYVGNHILGGSSLVSILGDEVRNKRGLSYSVYSYFSAMRVPGPFLMVAQTKNAKADETLRVMQDTLARYIQTGPSQAQLDSAKKNLIGGFPLKVSSNGKIVEYIAMIGFYGLPLDWLDTLPGKLRAVTVGKVRQAFARHLDPARNIRVIVGGKPE